MLEILAGPFDILTLDAVPLWQGSSADPDNYYYDDDVGLIVSASNLTSKKTWLVQLDGTATELSWNHYGSLLIDLDKNLPGVYLITNNPFNTSMWRYDKRSGTYGDKELGPGSYDYQRVRLGDRFIGAGSSGSVYRVIRQWSLDGSGGLNEFIFSDLPSNMGGKPAWSITRDPAVFAIAYPNGTIVYYNHILKQGTSERSFIGSNLGAWYSPRFNVWVKLTLNAQLEIYATTPKPHALSNPAGTTPARGRVTTYTVQLTGDAGEPCQNELIDWSLQPGDPGALGNLQSRTDSAGIAAVDYIAPVVSALGNITITAEVRF